MSITEYELVDIFLSLFSHCALIIFCGNYIIYLTQVIRFCSKESSIENDSLSFKKRVIVITMLQYLK